MHGIKIKTIIDNKITMNELIFKSADGTVSVNFTGQLSQSHTAWSPQSFHQARWWQLTGQIYTVNQFMETADRKLAT